MCIRVSANRQTIPPGGCYEASSQDHNPPLLLFSLLEAACDGAKYCRSQGCRVAAGLRDWQMYQQVNRHDTKQYRELYAKPEVVKAVREGKPAHNGTVLVMAIFAAQVDADGKRHATPRAISSKANLSASRSWRSAPDGARGAGSMAQRGLAVRIVSDRQANPMKKPMPASKHASSATFRTPSRIS